MSERIMLKRIKEKDIPNLLMVIDCKMKLSKNDWRITYLCNSLSFKTFNHIDALGSFLFNVMFNDKEGFKKISEFKHAHYFTTDSYGNFYILNRKTEQVEYALINTFDGQYDISSINYNKKLDIDFSLVYKNDIIHAIWHNNQVINSSIIEYKIEGFDESVYLTRFRTFDSLIKESNPKGKDWIKHYLFHDTNETGILYFLKLKYNNTIFYKVGITKFSVSKRFQNLKEVQILDSIEINLPMIKCAIIERYIHETNKHLKEEFITFDFEGKTECYVTNMFSLYDEFIFEKSLKYLDKINYPLSSNIIKSILKEKGIK